MVIYTIALAERGLKSVGGPKSRREFGRIMLPAEVAQLVEQWSEEPPPRGFRKLLDNSRLIPIFGVKEQWSQWSIVLECGGQVALVLMANPESR